MTRPPADAGKRVSNGRDRDPYTRLSRISDRGSDKGENGEVGSGRFKAGMLNFGELRLQRLCPKRGTSNAPSVELAGTRSTKRAKQPLFDRL
jgi:hypothetical protein